MLSYYDESGELVNQCLGLPAIEAKWLLFEKPKIEEMVKHLKTDMIDEYIILNHQSFSVMNSRLMDYKGAFGLCNMPVTNKNKDLAIKFNESYKIYIGVSSIDNVFEKELTEYLYRVFNNDYGFIFDKVDKFTEMKYLFKTLEENTVSVSINKLKSISFFVDYDDLFRAIVTLYISDPKINRHKKIENNISIKRIKEINNIYGCRIAGSAKIKFDYKKHCIIQR